MPRAPVEGQVEVASRRWLAYEPIMIVHLPRVLDDAQLARLREIIAAEPFVSGAGTATGAAQKAKHNLQLPPESDAAKAAAEFLLECLRPNRMFLLAVQPRAFVQPLFARYEIGMSYGHHLDAAMLFRGNTIRSDVSITVFLNASSEFDGGELMIDAGAAEVRLKADAGDCIVYPSSTRHRVAEVTRGTREVAVLWAQSLVRDPAHREILYDLGCALQYYELTNTGGPYIERLRKCEANLKRLWVEL